MLRCSAEAFARCPSREICGNIQDAMFMEGSDCDRFNRSVADQPMTNGDWIRSMSDEGLAMFFASYAVEDKRLRMESAGILQTETQLAVTEAAMCHSWLEWFRKPYKEGKV